MKLRLAYGNHIISLDVGDRSIQVVEPLHLPIDEGSVSRSLADPNGPESFNSFISKRNKLLVVINDHTRPLVRSVLEMLPLKRKDVTTIVASGTHRTPNSKELSLLIGGNMPPYGGHTIIHNANDPVTLKPLGRTSRGTDVAVNSCVFDTDGIITIGSVEPHYYAGFTGGRKFLLPGLAAFKSIEMNHSLALDDKARILTLKGNPVHEDFMDALRLFNRNEDIFSIQLVMNTEQQIGYASSGHIISSFMHAVERTTRTYSREIETKADILIACVNSPLDIDLYQAHKAIENVKQVLNDGGVLILVAECRDGIGNKAFYDLLLSKRDLNTVVREKYTFGGHKALKINELLQRAKIFAVTKMESKLLTDVSIVPFSDVQTAVDQAIALKGSAARIVLVQDAGVTVPTLSK
jgi:nickel-dependent lactate racemase